LLSKAFLIPVPQEMVCIIRGVFPDESESLFILCLVILTVLVKLKDF